jgi:hypothetical protein
MGAIKDIVDLAKDLESRAKDRHDMDTIHKIQSLAFSLQSQYVDTMERDVRLIEENAELKRKLAEFQEEEVRFANSLEFRRGKRTGGKWVPFCPKCHVPTVYNAYENKYLMCTACKWNSLVDGGKLHEIISGL